MQSTIETIVLVKNEQNISNDLDAKICSLLTVCFPHETIFRERRWLREQPATRVLAFIGDDLIGQLAVHEKNCSVGKFLGVAEVCIAPQYRKRGFVGLLLKTMEKHYQDFCNLSFLFGEESVYQKYGYQKACNIIFPDVSNSPAPSVMVKYLSNDQYVFDLEKKIIVPGYHF